MTRRALLWLSASVFLLVLGLAAYVVGRTGNGYLWLDGEPDPLSSDLSLFVAGGCDPEVQIRSLTVDESAEAVEVEVLVRWPLGIGAPACGTFEGSPHVIHLQQPLGDREVYLVLPSGGRQLVRPSPF